MNISEPIRRHAQVTPDGIAVIRADHRAVTWRDLDRLTDRAARYFLRLGLAPGQIVAAGITGPNELVGLIGVLALARLGIVTADPVLPDAHLDAALVQEGQPSRPGLSCVPLDAYWIEPPPDAVAAPVAPHRDGTAICRILASSGTSGAPKFAPVSHAVMARRVTAHAVSARRAEAAHICATGIGSALGFRAALRSLWFGGTLVLSNPADAAEAIRLHQVRSMTIAPISLQHLLGALPADARPLPSLDVVEVSGSALPPALAAAARQRLCPNIVTEYGSTECGLVASAPVAMLGGDPRAVGFLHADVEVRVTDDDGRDLPAGAEGLLCVRTGAEIAGYFRDPAGTAAAFRDGWYCGGDIGRLSPAGVLSVTGRRGDLINAGGEKISPHVVEDVLLTLPQVREAAAFGVTDRMGVTQVWAAIVADGAVATDRLSRLCGETLGLHAPKFILQLRGLPRNGNGKVLRDELARYAEAHQP